MRGENYFLVLVTKDDNLFKVHKEPLSLLDIDRRTVLYSGKKELVETILSNNKTLKPSDVKEVKIYRKPNLKKEEYKEEKGPLYVKDKNVIPPLPSNVVFERGKLVIISSNGSRRDLTQEEKKKYLTGNSVDYEDSFHSKLELMCLNKAFVLYYIKKYAYVKGLAPLVQSIKAAIDNDVDYMESFEPFLEKMVSTYKGRRDAYFSVKNFQTRYNRAKKEQTDYVYKPTSEELREDELIYLINNERELLDIEDFSHNKDLDIFDCGYGKSK